MDKKTLLYRLGEAKLKWPVGLRKFIYNKTDYRTTNRCGTYYVDTLEIWHDKLLMRTFAFRVPTIDGRPFKMDIQEVCRRLEGEKEVLVCQIENRSMGGRIVYYTDSGKWITKKERSSYYSWYVGNKKSWWFYEYEMFDIKEWIQRLNIPYCGYDSVNYKYKIPFIRYVELYRQYPKIELLAKAGWGHLITGARYFNFNGKSFEQIFKVSKYWKSHLNKLSVRDILLIRKYKTTTMTELNIQKEIKRYHMEYIRKYFDKKMTLYIDGFGIEKFPYHEYNDYLMMSERMGYPMNRNDVLYPKEGIMEAHDKVQKEFTVNESKKLKEGIEITANKLMKYEFENNELIIIPAKSNDDLVKESEELNHCVRTYAQKVSEGKTGIMFVRKKGEIEKPYVTLELQGKRVTQVRAARNSMPPEDVCNFIRVWEKHFRLSGW